jgi:uncharacterized protein YbaP (TraB family)
MLRTLCLALVSALVGLVAGAAHAQPPLWVVRGQHATIILFGSVHLLPPGLDWEPPRLAQAVKDARDIWFEVPLDDAAELAAAQFAVERGLQPAGATLDAQLSDAGRARLARVAQANGVPPDGLQHLRPWLAEITLSLAGYRKAGAVQDQGVERQLGAKLPPGVERRAFETPGEQIEALSAAPVRDQIASLEETLVELEGGEASYGRLIKAWMAGDVAGVKREALDPLTTAAPGVYRTMVVDRNRRWIDAIEARLKGSGQAVMVVGVGHLIGPDGLPALLRAKGLTVEGP